MTDSETREALCLRWKSAEGGCAALPRTRDRERCSSMAINFCLRGSSWAWERLLHTQDPRNEGDFSITPWLGQVISDTNHFFPPTKWASLSFILSHLARYLSTGVIVKEIISIGNMLLILLGSKLSLSSLWGVARPWELLKWINSTL